MFNIFKLCCLHFLLSNFKDFMNVPTAKQYVFNTGICVGIGAVVSVVLKNLQVWRSPNGGIIACLFAERVAANPLHINMGIIVTGTATVPFDYTLVGKIVPTICTFNTLLISCIGVGILIGVCYTLKKRQNANCKFLISF
jgi:hypothetical protein